VLALFLIWLALSWSARAQVERAVAALRAAGEPATPAEVAPALVAEEENGAPVYQKAFGEMRVVNVQGHEKLKGIPVFAEGRWEGMSFPDLLSHLDGMRIVLELHGPAFALVDRAQALPRCRFDVAYEDGLSVMLAHLADVRGLARLYRDRARVRLYDGDAAGALGDVRRCLRVADALEMEPILISLLVRTAVAGIAVQTIQDMWAHGVFAADTGAGAADGAGAAGESIASAEAAAARLVRALAAVELWSAMRPALMGERAFGIDAIEGVLRGDHTMFGGKPSSGGRALMSLGGFWLRWNQMQYIEYMNELVVAAGLPPHEAIAAALDVENRLKDLPKWRGVFAQLMLPALGTALQTVAQTQMKAHTAAVGVACDLRMRRGGELPTDASALAPEFFDRAPTDAFDGKPLRIAKTPDGFMVYSVGPDGADDGGSGDDIVWQKRPAVPVVPTPPSPPKPKRK
jgi:hypothetical protein